MTVKVAIAYSFNDRAWFGGRNYFASLFHAVAAVGFGRFEFVLLTGNRTETTLPAQFPFLEVVRTGLLDRMHPAWFYRQLTLRALDTDPALARLLRRRRIGILSHSGQLGRDPGVKTAAWLYDFQFMHLSEYWQRKHIRWAEQRYRAACRNSDALIVSSESAMKDLERFAPWCMKPKHVLRFVSNPVDFAAVRAREETIRKYGLPDIFFYLPNQFWKNKNHGLVVAALKRLNSCGVRATVACTGHTYDGRQPKYFDDLMSECAKAGVLDQFRVLGVVPYEDTQALMAHALAVINPSRFEGWSTTVEEAKTMRKVLLLSDISVHREQSPELGRFFHVDDERTLADLMLQCLEEGLRAVSAEEIERAYAPRLRAFGESYLDILTGLSN